jgi:hypothetical protein
MFSSYIRKNDLYKLLNDEEKTFCDKFDIFNESFDENKKQYYKENCLKFLADKMKIDKKENKLSKFLSK